MAYKVIATDIINAIETRITINQTRGNSNVVTLRMKDEDIKLRMGLDRLRSITRQRIINKLEQAGYTVVYISGAMVITVDPAVRDCEFDSLEDLEESIEDFECEIE